MSPSGKGRQQRRSTSTSACRMAESTARTGCGRDRPVRLRSAAIADGDRTHPGHHLALRQVTVADGTLGAWSQSVGNQPN
jgi:hypothetical protein